MNNCSSNAKTLSFSEKSGSMDVILPEIPEDIIYPNELNTFLRDQLRYYVHKSGMLEQNLSDLEDRYSECQQSMSKLQLKVSDYESTWDKSNVSISSNVVSSKIVDLSKKLREKMSEVESLKTKFSKLEKHAFDLKHQLENESHVNVNDNPNASTNTLPDDEVKRYNDKFNGLNLKLAEEKNMNLQLKNELKLAKKALQQEVGDNFENIQAIFKTNTSGWRGRAQIICDLQIKNTELKEKLKQAQERAGPTPPEIIQSPSKADIQLSTLTKEQAELKNKFEELRKKHEMLKARHKVLDMEFNVLKSKISMMNDQAVRDQDIIANLSKNISISKEAKNETLLQKESFIVRVQTENKQLLQEIEEYKIIIKELRDEIDALKKKKEYNVSIKDETSNEQREAKQEKGETNNTEARYKQILELLETTNSRLNMERESHAKTQAALRHEKQKVTRTEALMARMELETSNSVIRSSYSSTNTLRSLEPSLKDHLELAEENLKAVKTRLEIEQMERKADLQSFTQILKRYDIQNPYTDSS